MILNQGFPDFNSSFVKFLINNPIGNPESTIAVKMIIVNVFILNYNKNSKTVSHILVLL